MAAAIAFGRAKPANSWHGDEDVRAVHILYLVKKISALVQMQLNLGRPCSDYTVHDHVMNSE